MTMHTFRAFLGYVKRPWKSLRLCWIVKNKVFGQKSTVSKWTYQFILNSSADSSPKIEHDFSNKGFQKLKLSKKSFNKKCAPRSVFFIFRKIWMTFDIDTNKYSRVLILSWEKLSMYKDSRLLRHQHPLKVKLIHTYQVLSKLVDDW